MKTKLIVAIITGVTLVGVSLIERSSPKKEISESISIGDNSTLINRSGGNNIINSGNVTNNIREIR